jgi:hypothetical protein
MEMGGSLSKDSDWAFIDGRACEVLRFTPLAKLDDGEVISRDRTLPYAFIDMACLESGVNLPAETVGAVCHKDDFIRLWAAFVERGVEDDEKVVILWSKKNLKAAVKLFSPFMPRLAVTIFKAEAYQLLIDFKYRPELRGEARLLAELPTHHWQPDVWKEPVVSTLYDYYITTYMRTGEEKYLSLIENYK